MPSGLPESPIHLDYNATTPIDPAVTAATLPFLTGGFGNPSSDTHYGSAPRAAVQRARARVAALLGTPAADGIVFTGSGSEADNLALRGVVLAAGSDRPCDHPMHRAPRDPAGVRGIAALARPEQAALTEGQSDDASRC